MTPFSPERGGWEANFPTVPCLLQGVEGQGVSPTELFVQEKIQRRSMGWQRGPRGTRNVLRHVPIGP